MIEVEIRGELNKEEKDNFLNYLKTNGKHIEDHDRQMVLFYDYPGFDINPLKRDVDMRLRETNGVCEIMIKNKVEENNLARNELSINLSNNTWSECIDLAKSFGIKKGLWMRRLKNIYELNDVEYSIVTAVDRDQKKELYYFEAEKLVETKDKIENVFEDLKKDLAKFTTNFFSPEDYKNFVELLAREVNEEILL